MREEQLIRQVEFISFSNSQPAIQTDGLGFLHWQPVSNRNQALIGQFRVKMIVFGWFFGSRRVVDSPILEYVSVCGVLEHECVILQKEKLFG